MIKEEVKLSAEFKAQTTKAILAIAFFVITYIAILLLAVGLMLFCIYAGLMLIMIHPSLITIVLGLGLASLGGLILIFLLKFIFKSNKVDRSHLHEIKKTEEPRLFQLIDEIVKEVGTDFPKKVYLSADVNAAVFYDSSFWSMFFPIKKNLQIGMGLINTVSEAELKAILAHEFGHFSQKTMKVGSYVYNVNQIIFNMLYDNESYGQLVQGWASISSYLYLFVILAVKIVQGIQWILQKLYGVVNKAYMALSREMEFHADEIAASVTGYEPLKHSLLRMTLADYSFNAVLLFYDAKVAENLKSENIYREQQLVMNFLAEVDGLPMLNNLPQVTLEQLNRFNKSKIVITDQWASHPSTEDRIERLEKTARTSQLNTHGEANKIFNNLDATQRLLTTKMFNGVVYKGEAKCLDIENFDVQFRQEYRDNTFSELYNGYYDNRNPLPLDLDSTHTSQESIELEELFSPSKIDLVISLNALQHDIELLKQIANEPTPFKTFDYDGKKYKKAESKVLIPQLNAELDLLNEEIKQNDQRIFNFFANREKHHNGSAQLRDKYKAFFEFDKIFDTKYSIYTSLIEQLQFISLVTPVDQIQSNFSRLRPLEEQLKAEIAELMADSRYVALITQEMKDNFESYGSRKWRYFDGQEYDDQKLQVLYAAINNYSFLLSKGYFLLKKELLTYQEELLQN